VALTTAIPPTRQKPMLRPSGDQDRQKGQSPRATLRTAVPFCLMTKMPDSRLKAIRRPSGDQASPVPAS
jgi:hypothetical protein